MASASVQPTQFKKRSFAAPRLIDAGAEFEAVNGAATAVRFGRQADELNTAARCGLVDLSPLPRFGIKGRGAPEWAADQGVQVPEQPNTAVRQDDGGLAARLSGTEILLLGDLNAGSRCDDLEKAWWRDRASTPDAARGYTLPRGDSHCWFRVTGKHAAEMFAKICAVDLRPHKFDELAVAQTSAARTTTIVVRDDLTGGGERLLSYQVLADSASACYFWDCLLDAMEEFDGGPVGLATLRQLA